jgi:miniconductance mechanosensitive channel
MLTHLCAMNLVELSDWLRAFLWQTGLHHKPFAYAYFFISLASLGLICFLIWSITRFIIIRIVKRMVAKTTATWDDKLFEFKVFRSLSLILIAVVISKAIPYVILDFPNWTTLLVRSSKVYIVLSVMFALNAILNATLAVLDEIPTLRDKPLRSYKQVTKIVFYLIGFVLILAIVLGQSPLYILGGFGAVTAVLILVFRDPILGFVASIQMSAVDLIRIGDWITVDKYGADGEVIEINLTTLKVRNWDMTVTVVPSYAIVSESFRNWRGMEESDGRRIKRHLNIKMSSIRFVDDALLDKLKKVERIRTYINERQAEIVAYNQANQVDKSLLLNGRHMTNIGIFRVYAEKYLEQNPYINTDMTFMVRQLQPTEHGLPIEVYAFSKEKTLESFEGVAADIFDHLLAAVPYFELEIFQSPSGSDMRGLTNKDEKGAWHENL